ADFGGDGTEPAGAQHVGGGKEAGDQLRRRQLRGGDEGAVGERNPGEFRLGADGADELAVDAGALVAGPADLAGVVRGEDRADHELARLDRAHFGADVFDDADVLVAPRRRALDGFDAPVGPQVRPADAGGGEAADGGGRFDGGGGRSVLGPDVG